MPVTVELFGLPRHRAGVAEVEIEAGSVADALQQLEAKLPALGKLCDETLRSGYLLNLNGRTFITDPQFKLQPGDTLLLFSPDMGG